MKAFSQFVQWVAQFAHYLTLDRLNPTALCIRHEAIHAERPAGDAARAALRRLRGFGLLLLILPRSNIYIRHHLTLSALYLETGSGLFHYHARKALDAMRRMCEGPAGEAYPFLEGFSYLLYTEAAYTYWATTCGPSKEWRDLIAAQHDLLRAMSLPDGRVPTADTHAAHRVDPDDARYAMHPCFTVIRTEYKTMIVHHDERLRLWRARLNFHLSMTYGRIVRRGSDWEWYNGWQNKKTRLRDHLWRVWFPDIYLAGRNTNGVTFNRAGKCKTETI